VVDDHGIQYGNRGDGRAVHQPAKEEQQWSDPCWISEEPGGFSDIRKDFGMRV